MPGAIHASHSGFQVIQKSATVHVSPRFIRGIPVLINVHLRFQLYATRCDNRKIGAEVVVTNIIWIIVIGFVAGIIARVLMPGPNNPNGFILTTVLGIAGAFLSTFIGQAVGWYRLDQGAGLIGATVGALIVLFIWHRLVVHHVIGDPGAPPGSGPPTSRRWL